MLDDPIFRDAVKHNGLLLLSVPVVLVLALAIAFVLHEAITRLARLPDDRLPAVHDRDPGARHDVRLPGEPERRVNETLRSVGLGFLAQDWLGDPSWVLGTVAVIIIYHELGFGVVLFLARLLSLPEEVDQAAAARRLHLVAAAHPRDLPQMRGVIRRS